MIILVNQRFRCKLSIFLFCYRWSFLLRTIMHLFPLDYCKHTRHENKHIRLSIVLNYIVIIKTLQIKVVVLQTTFSSTITSFFMVTNTYKYFNNLPINYLKGYVFKILMNLSDVKLNKIINL